ncbi:hypothetical protein Y032_0248g74 [Ancylostoma ceylanicum]|uniref:Uncharacterized protein n=1 Tax=Ancylostoma ceylanicum TaxID=53326 RepID=A0A016SDB7_9BILA|nr:hypothetical protein Y032_0248g74 [Ancylostoma ceylanicum]
MVVVFPGARPAPNMIYRHVEPYEKHDNEAIHSCRDAIAPAHREAGAPYPRCAKGGCDLHFDHIRALSVSWHRLKR